MLKNKIIIGIGALIAGTTLAFALTGDTSSNVSTNGTAGSGSVSTQVSASSTSGNSSSTTTKMTSLVNKANKEIDGRVAALNKLRARIDGLKNLSADNKASLSANIQSQATALTNLKSKISGDTDIITAKADFSSIAGSYRTFLVSLPTDEITTTIDMRLGQINTLASSTANLSAQIQTAQSAGKDVTAAQAKLNDMNARISDAQAQYKAAINLIAPLTPDNGDKTIMASNKAAIKQARASLKIALKDIQTAQSDSKSITRALKKLNVTVNATSTTNVSTH
ncbi:MAG: hypothetical protein JWN37_121 [Candidatus Nomurabacteria bacterium]|nr:hypothetical protein [Candidatus Nomurabacteria bacterium]